MNGTQGSPSSTSYLTPEYLQKHHWRLPEDDERREQLLTETEYFFDAIIERAANALGEEGRAETISVTLTLRAYVAGDCLCFCPGEPDDRSGGRCTRPCVHVPW